MARKNQMAYGMAAIFSEFGISIKPSVTLRTFVISYSLGVVLTFVFLALVMKSAVLKYGGPPLLARLRPLFLGLVLGEASVGGFWVAVDAVTGMEGNTLRGVFFC